MKYGLISIVISLLGTLFIIDKYVQLITTYNGLDEMWKANISPAIVALWIKIVLVALPIGLLSLVLSIRSKKRIEKYSKVSLTIAVIEIFLTVFPLWIFLYV